MSRDIKLENTLLVLQPDKKPLLKLCDFGYSKVKQWYCFEVGWWQCCSSGWCSMPGSCSVCGWCSVPGRRSVCLFACVLKPLCSLAALPAPAA